MLFWYLSVLVIAVLVTCRFDLLPIRWYDHTTVTKMFQQKEVVIIGGGISGLCATNLLHEHGLDVVLLEASERVGGRTYTLKIQDRVLRVAKQLDIDHYKIIEDAKLVWVQKGIFYPYMPSTAYYPKFWNPFVWLDMNNIGRQWDAIGSTIPSDAPWDCPNAEELDKMTMQQWIHRNTWTKTGHDFCCNMVSQILTSEPHELSVLFFMWYIKVCEGFMRTFAAENGGQERKFVGGSQEISLRLLEKLGKERVILESPVINIEQNDDGAFIKTLNGDIYKAKYVVMAMPPGMVQKIHFKPPLPPLRNQLIARAPVGSVLKCIVYYKTQFWREKGFCGSSWGIDPDIPIKWSLDDTKPDGTAPALITFITANKAREFCELSKDERQAKICQYFASAFDSEEALHPVNYVEKNWMEEPYIGGCYTTVFSPGTLFRYGRELRKPVGCVHFGGTETARKWAGYMDGAVESGERAAREILFEEGKIREDEIWHDEPESKEVPTLPFQTTFLERNAPTARGFYKFLKNLAVLGTLAGVFVIYKKRLL
ncbi:amine oxidase [flavin-containing]-like [Anneissia japonica]|uniref:amine oxidase [flavin-containing]-like n=1 Tax=Anneissia japonica TaxID=1529436 RepID=UPI001425A4D2|nr:amine oxidase [flavin-containing]-like [Anneissia japonica]